MAYHKRTMYRGLTIITYLKRSLLGKLKNLFSAQCKLNGNLQI